MKGFILHIIWNTGIHDVILQSSHPTNPNSDNNPKIH